MPFHCVLQRRSGNLPLRCHQNHNHAGTLIDDMKRMPWNQQSWIRTFILVLSATMGSYESDSCPIPPPVYRWIKTHVMQCPTFMDGPGLWKGWHSRNCRFSFFLAASAYLAFCIIAHKCLIVLKNNGFYSFTPDHISWLNFVTSPLWNDSHDQSWGYMLELADRVRCSLPSDGY